MDGAEYELDKRVLRIRQQAPRPPIAFLVVVLLALLGILLAVTGCATGGTYYDIPVPDWGGKGGTVSQAEHHP